MGEAVVKMWNSGVKFTPFGLRAVMMDMLRKSAMVMMDMLRKSVMVQEHTMSW